MSVCKFCEEPRYTNLLHVCSNIPTDELIDFEEANKLPKNPGANPTHLLHITSPKTLPYKLPGITVSVKGNVALGEVTRIPIHIEGKVARMKLWLIQRDYKNVYYDEWDALLIRAESEQEARAIACAYAISTGYRWIRAGEPSTCIEVKVEGKPGLVLGSFNAG